MNLEAEATLHLWDFALSHNMDKGTIFDTQDGGTLSIKNGSFVTNNYKKVINKLKQVITTSDDPYTIHLAKGLLKRIN